MPRACPDCGNQDIHAFGRGTQRPEERLAERREAVAAMVRLVTRYGPESPEWARCKQVIADVIGVAVSQDRACVLVMPVRDGRLVGDQKYILNHRMEEDDDVLSGFIKLHYANPLNVPPEASLSVAFALSWS